MSEVGAIYWQKYNADMLVSAFRSEGGHKAWLNPSPTAGVFDDQATVDNFQRRPLRKPERGGISNGAFLEDMLANSNRHLTYPARETCQQESR